MLLLLDGLENVHVHLDNILHVTKGSWDEHVEVLEEIFIRLHTAGFKINAKKSRSGVNELEYLGYRITSDGIQPI